MIPGPRLARLAIRLPIQALLRPLSLDGQTLDPRVRWLLKLEDLLAVPPLSARSAEVARQGSSKTMPLLAPTGEGGVVTDSTLQGPAGTIPVRRYLPQGAGQGPHPTLLYFHGGGWVVGDLETHDGVCRAFAARARCQVIAVDYRLAPENPYPAAVEDAWAALTTLASHPSGWDVDPARLAVGGDSAGGNLAAVLALRARDAGHSAPCLQLLVYPSTDNSRETRSYELFQRGFLLSRDDIRWFRDNYLPDTSRRTERDASPLLAEDVDGLAPACVLTAGFDPLRDEGRAYADRLAAAGVPTQYDCFPDLVHGFLNLAGAVPAAERAFDHAAEALRQAFRS